MSDLCSRPFFVAYRPDELQLGQFSPLSRFFSSSRYFLGRHGNREKCESTRARSVLGSPRWTSIGRALGSYGATVPGVELKILWLVEEGELVRRRPAHRIRPRALPEGARRGSRASEGAEGRNGPARVGGGRDRGLGHREAGDAEGPLRSRSSRRSSTSARRSRRGVGARGRAERALTAGGRDEASGLEPFVEEGYMSQEEYRTAVARRDQSAEDLHLARARHAALVHQTTPDSSRRSRKRATSGMERASYPRRDRARSSRAPRRPRPSSARLDEANRLVAESRRRIAACPVTCGTRADDPQRDLRQVGRAAQDPHRRLGLGRHDGRDAPDLSLMLVDGRVAESEIHLLAAGDARAVRLDAFPDLALSGGCARSEASEPPERTTRGPFRSRSSSVAIRPTFSTRHGRALRGSRTPDPLSAHPSDRCRANR